MKGELEEVATEVIPCRPREQGALGPQNPRGRETQRPRRTRGRPQRPACTRSTPPVRGRKSRGKRLRPQLGGCPEPLSAAVRSDEASPSAVTLGHVVPSTHHSHWEKPCRPAIREVRSAGGQQQVPGARGAVLGATASRGPGAGAGHNLRKHSCGGRHAAAPTRVQPGTTAASPAPTQPTGTWGACWSSRRPLRLNGLGRSPSQ